MKLMTHVLHIDPAVKPRDDRRVNARNNSKGVTLLELVVGLVIVTILAAGALPLYLNHVRRARRVDAIQTLLAMQLAEESYRANNSLYGTLAQAWNDVATTSGGYYTLAISNISATGYTLTATALSTQTSDAENGVACSSLVLSMSSGVETNTPSACWLRQ